MAKDQFGIDLVYKTKPNTASWFMDNEEADNDSRFYIGSGTDGIKSVGGGWWRCNSNDQVRLNAQTPLTVNMNNSDGGCDMDFETASAKGNAGMSDRWRDIEMTCKFNLTTFSPADGRLILKGPTFHHDDSPCCSGHAYGVRFFFGTTLQIQFFKEMWHVNYFSRTESPISTAFTSIKDGNDHIVKFVRYNKLIGSVMGVVLEAYLDDDGDGTNFVKVAEAVDIGGWGSGGDTCNGNDDQILDWGSGWMQYRWDGVTDLKFKDWSVREIDPFASVEIDPVDPEDTSGSTELLVIPFVLPFHVNAHLENPCMVAGGGGGGGGINPVAFYEIAINASNPNELSNVSANDNRTRTAVFIESTASPCYNKKPFSCDFALRKVNSPNVASISSKIWRKPNTVIYTSPTTFTDASLTTSFAYKTFDYSTCTRFLQVGDLIGVEYINADGTNYVEFCYISDIAGNGTRQTQYEGTVWDDNNRELSCRLFPSI